MTHLILGGARSGKSRFALAAAEAATPRRVFIATAEAFDAEMADRIARHRDERDATWATIEAPRDLCGVLEPLLAGGDAVLVDCLTLWLSNLLLADADIERETERLAALVAGAPRLFLVSNEVGMGLVPDTPLGRAFRDAQGRLNQRIGAVADRVDFVAAGLPLRLK